MSPAISRPCAFLSLLALAFPSGCRSTDDAGASAPYGASQALPRGASTEDPREVIAKLEDARSDGDGLLEAYLSSGTESSRILAATALGRMPFPDLGDEGTRALEKALGDPSSRVRAAAAFAIGMRGDPSAAGALVEARPDRDPNVRARIVEAASRLDDPRARALVLEALSDPEPVVRQEAAVGPSRWRPDAKPDAKNDGKDGTKDATDVDAALVLAAQSTAKADVEVVWRALFSLARRKSVEGRAAFEAGLASPDARARIFGAQGLRGISPEGLALQKLRAALADADWRVVCESALAIAAHPQADAVQDLGKALGHASPHVRRCAAEALAQFKDAKKEALQLLWTAKSDPSVDVRCSILVARAELGGDSVAADVETAAGDRNPLLRAGAAAAAGALGDARGLPLLLQLSKDRDAHVVDIAVHAMKDKSSPEIHARLLEMLADKDNGVRLAAADVLKDLATAADLPALARCMDTSRGEISDEIHSTIVDTAGRLAKADGGRPAKDILQQASFSENDFVRRKARALVEEVEPGAKFSGRPAPAAGAAKSPAVPLPGVDYPVAGPNPSVVIETSRGKMVFELLRNEAPVHVHNFLALAARGFYDGTTFHRVVPDFVVQGGDPRGDGNGCTTFRGETLRGEFTPRKFVRGSLGMPRNDDPDSGGCQIFVTHRETPHLDGRYTLFGEMREGFDVFDRIELGDTIRTVKIVDAAGSASAPAN